MGREGFLLAANNMPGTTNSGGNWKAGGEVCETSRVWKSTVRGKHLKLSLDMGSNFE